MPAEITQESGVVSFSSGATPIGFVVPPEAAYDAWAGYLEQAGEIHEASRWWIGDLLNFGEERWPQEFSQAIPSQYTPKTLIDLARVARATPLEERQDYEGRLTWSHHRAVVPFEGDERRALLDQAASQELSVDALREVVREQRESPPRDPDGPLEGDILTDTTWSGTVVVQGPIKTAGDATLTITPGTRVHFV